MIDGDKTVKNDRRRKQERLLNSWTKRKSNCVVFFRVASQSDGLTTSEP